MVQTELISIIREIKENNNIVIETDTNIIEEIGLDSLQLINFILMIEDKFNIEIDFDEFDYVLLTNLSYLVDFISQKCEGMIDE